MTFMDEKEQIDEQENDLFEGYTKRQLASVSRFNKAVIEHAKELEKAVARERKRLSKVRDHTGEQL